MCRIFLYFFFFFFFFLKKIEVMDDGVVVGFLFPPSLLLITLFLSQIVANEMVGYVSQGSSGYRVGCSTNS